MFPSKAPSYWSAKSPSSGVKTMKPGKDRCRCSEFRFHPLTQSSSSFMVLLQWLRENDVEPEMMMNVSSSPCERASMHARSHVVCRSSVSSSHKKKSEQEQNNLPAEKTERAFQISFGTHRGVFDVIVRREALRPKDQQRQRRRRRARGRRR